MRNVKHILFNKRKGYFPIQVMPFIHNEEWELIWAKSLSDKDFASFFLYSWFNYWNVPNILFTKLTG